MKKIAFIGSMGLPPKYGGFESAIYQITRRISNQYQIFVFSTDPTSFYFGRNIITPKIYQSGIPTIDRILRELIPLFLILTKFKVDLVHVHGPFLLAPMYKLFGKKIVMSTDGLEWQRRSYSKITKLIVYLGYLIGASFVDILTFDANFIRDYYLKFFHRTGYIVPYGPMDDCTEIEKHQVKSNLEPQSYFLFAGRLVEEKGIEILIESYNKIIHEELTNLYLVILGNDIYHGKYLNYLKSIADPKIRFVPAQFNCNYEYLVKNAYGIIRPSINTSEGLNPTLIEAMFWNGIVIASDVPQNLEVKNADFYYFEKGNSDDLYRKIRSVLELDNTSIDMKKKKNRNIVENNYSWDVIKTKITGIYQRVLSSSDTELL